MRRFAFCALPLLVGLVFAADEAPEWKSKQISAWSENDAKDLLADSPWAKQFTPTLRQGQDQSPARRLGSGISIGMPGIGGMGGGRRGGGGGYPGGGGQQGRSRNDNGGRDGNAPPKVILRWESAMPIRTAELKIRENEAPTLDGNHYAIAVYGIPDHFLIGERKKLADQLKGKASIKRDGKKDFKPSSVELLDRSDGPVVVYLFPMSNEITKGDRRLEFDADIGALQLVQSFFTEDMTWEGKLEL